MDTSSCIRGIKHILDDSNDDGDPDTINLPHINTTTPTNNNIRNRIFPKQQPSRQQQQQKQICHRYSSHRERMDRLVSSHKTQKLVCIFVTMISFVVLDSFPSSTPSSSLFLSLFAVTAIRITPSMREELRQQQRLLQVIEDEDYSIHNTTNNNHHPFIREEEQQMSNSNASSSITRKKRRKLDSHPSDEHLVDSLPLLADEDFLTAHWAGLLPASSTGDKYLFYWLFAPDTTNAGSTNIEETDIPLIIWLNGGPGCSSMDGLFIENGPFRFVLTEERDKYSAWKIKVNQKYSWHSSPAYVVYIDQPVGTGLSYTTSRNKYPKNDEEVNIDFYYFLTQFLLFHEDKFLNPLVATTTATKRPIYFSGESHAGHYIPSMMAYILKQNEKINNENDNGDDNSNNDKVYINLHGAAIGNGWMDPFHQYAAAAAAYGHGIIGKAQVTGLDEKERECQISLNKQQYSSSVCFRLLDDIISQSHGKGSAYKISQYDVRKTEPARGATRSFPIGHKTIEAYLGGRSTGSEGGTMPPNIYQDVLEAIHATASRNAGQNYQECTDPPYDALSHQDGLGVVDDVIYILEYTRQKVRLLFFNGIEDLICNHVGNEIFLENMKWEHQMDYIKSKRYAWRSPLETQEGKISGYIKEYDNHLLFLKLLDSGHMVPMDIPHVALSMMQTFIYDNNNKELSGFLQNEQQLLTKEPSETENCPVCPAGAAAGEGGTGCNDGDTTANNNNKSKSNYFSNSYFTDEDASANGTKIIAFTWIGLFVVLALVVIVMFQNKRRARRITGGGINVGAIPISQSYDLEMTHDTNGLYRDNALSLSDVENDDIIDSDFDDSYDRDDDDNDEDYNNTGTTKTPNNRYRKKNSTESNNKTSSSNTSNGRFT